VEYARLGLNRYSRSQFHTLRCVSLSRHFVCIKVFTSHEPSPSKLYPSPLCSYSGHLQTSKKPGDEPNRRLLLPFHSHTFALIRQSVHANFASCLPHLEAQENIRNISDSTFTFSHLSILSGRGVVSSQRSESVCSHSKHCHV
jgi:hypothetical protein